MRSFVEQYSKLDVAQDFPKGFCKDGPCKSKQGEKITELADEDLFRTGYWRTKDNKFRDVGYLYPPLDLTCPKEDLPDAHAASATTGGEAQLTGESADVTAHAPRQGPA